MPGKPLPLKPWQARLIKYGAPASVFDKKDTRISSWKPWSLRPPFLGLFVCFSMGLLVCIEILRRRSGRDGGLAFYSTSNDVPTAVFIAYNYAPTILATLFSILWSIVDLDAKRMEPYTQISDPHSSQFPLSLLFLDYAFEPPWKIPFRACKRRHWTVAVTSLTFLVISIFLAPMQSALLGLTSVSKSHHVIVSNWSKLPPIVNQSQIFTGETVNQANSLIRNNASLPPFTTEKYAVSPLSGLTSLGGNTETWSLQARVYWSDLTCIDVPDFHLAPEPRDFFGQGVAITTLTWSTANITIPTFAINSTPCVLDQWEANVVDPRPGPGTYAVFNRISRSYNAPTSIDPTVAYDLSGCIEFPFITGLYALDPSLSDAKNVSTDRFNAVGIAAICKADYNSALGNVSLLANGSVSIVDISNEIQKVTLDKTVLDIDNFEDSISNAYHNLGDETSNVDPQHTFFGINPITMSSVIEANNPEPKTLDRAAFKDSVVRAYDLVFALSVTKALLSELSPEPSNETIAPDNIAATNTGIYIALVVSQEFAIASEVLLGCTALAAIFNLVTYLRRGSLLRHDPDSLAALLAFFNTHVRSNEILGSWDAEFETITTSQFMHAVGSSVCKLITEEAKLSFKICKTSGRPHCKVCNLSSERCLHQSPFEMASFYGILVLITTACALLLGVAYRRNFTYLATSSSLAAQALWQFAPTLAATVIGVLWTIVHRDLCLLEPWKRLSQEADAATTLSTNYASRIPQVVLVKTITRGPSVLSFVSLISTSTSVLSIAMGGLFFQGSSVIENSVSTFDIYAKSTLPSFDLSTNSSVWPLADAFELVRTNLSDDTHAPPWATQDIFFLPRRYETVNSTSSPIEHNVVTVGISASLDCRYIGSTDGQSELAFGWNVTSPDPSVFALDFPAHFEERGRGPGDPLGPHDPIITTSDECFVYYGSVLSSYEYATVFQGKADLDYQNHACDPYIPVLQRTPNSSHPNQTLQGILCWPRLELYNASVVLDVNSLVQHYELYATLDNSTSPFSNAPQHLQGFNDYFQNTDVIGDDTGSEGQAVLPYDWPGLLTARIQEMSHPNGLGHADSLIAAANRTWAQTFVAFWALYSDQFLTKATEPSAPTTGTASYQVARMIPSIPAFTVTFTLQALYVIAAILVYLKRRQQVTPRVPQSLATIIPWIIHSRILKDFAGTAHLSSRLRDEYLSILGKKYQFGWFRDEQGVIRLGLEESKYVFKKWKPGEQVRPHQHEAPLMGSHGSSMSQLA